MVTPNTKLKNLHCTKVRIYQTTDLPSHQTDAYFLVRTLDRAKDDTDTYLQSNKVNLVHIESRSSKRTDGAYQGRSLNFHFDFVALGVGEGLMSKISK